jgi:nicotinamide mononucleotide adenylyltransferase
MSSESLAGGAGAQPRLTAGLGTADTMTLDSYTFPKERMKTVLSNPDKTPLVLVSCGSFSPPTNLHLRMFEEAADYCEFETNFEVVGGFFSPVGDAYKKAGLASAHHRINMTRIAVQDSSQWIGVDPWEPLHKEYLPTVKVLDHFDHELNDVLGGIQTPDGERRRIHVALLAGADLIQTMSTPGTSVTRRRLGPKLMISRSMGAGGPRQDPWALWRLYSRA